MNNDATNMNNCNRRKNASINVFYMIIGILIGGMLSVFLLTVSAAALISAGFIHLGTNGEIYVTATASDESEGIGSKVEAKLNALESVIEEKFYFSDVDDEQAETNIYKAYLDSYGDKYTVYYTPEEYKQLMESTTGSFYGIGAVCQKNEAGGVLIVEPYKNSPAYKAGIRQGDIVIAVDDKDIMDMDLSSAVAIIKGDKGTTVKLTIKREEETIDISVVRDKVDIETVGYEILEDDIGYLAISQFDEVTTKQFKEAVDELMSKGIKGLVVDVRSNPGGLLSGVVEILDEILPDGLVLYTEDADGVRKEYRANNGREFNIPMAVLVNGNSASASEIFAGAIQDYEKGVIVGTQTFGKGIVQTILPLTDGSAVKFTISKYYTAKGQDIHGNGVTPDVIVELPKDATSDVQLEAAILEVKNRIR